MEVSLHLDLKSRARIAAAAVALLAASGISLAQNAPPAADAGSIVVYNGQHVELTKEWGDGFTRATGTKIVLRNGSDTELANQIVQEGSASPADVFLTENSPAMVLVDNAEQFAALDPRTLAQVPENFRPANGRWIGVAARSTVLAYNKSRLTPDRLPRSIMDLADPSWKGRWGAAPVGADFQAIVSAILELKGEAATLGWLKAMKQNAAPFKGNVAALKAVNDGQIDAAVIYHYYYYRDRAKTAENSNNTELYYFRNQDPGAFVSISGGGVLASSKHPSQAQAFLQYVTGKSGQEALRTGDSYEYAVGIGAQSNPALVPLADLQAPKVEPSKLNSKQVVDLMTAAGLL
jgi:iron(III) transport system substrate-binding protein